MVDESLKFAWAYLLTYGKLTNGKWNYYGGCWEEMTGGVSFERRAEQMAELRDAVVSIGIDWAKTDVPYVSEESEFMDTYSPSKNCLATLGTLILKNGETFKIGSGDDDAAHLAETARQMMVKQKSPVQELADKI